MQEPEYSEKGILAGNYMAIFQYASGDPPTKTMQLYIQIKAEETDGSPADLEKMCKFVRERQISGPGLRPGGERDMQGNLGAGRILDYTQVVRRLDQVRNSVGAICIQIRPGYFVTVNGTAWNYDASQIQRSSGF